MLEQREELEMGKDEVLSPLSKFVFFVVVIFFVLFCFFMFIVFVAGGVVFELAFLGRLGEATFY